jgi:predicted ester cyclase
MPMMKKLLTTTVCLLASGCATQQASEAPPVTPAASPAPEAVEAPAAASAGVPASTSTPAAPPAPLSAEDRAKLFQDCWAAFNAKEWAKFGPCYTENASSEDVDSGTPKNVGRQNIVEKGAQVASQAPDVVGEPQLVLVNGEHLASIVLLKGTNSGPLQGPGGATMPATNKKFAFLLGHTGEFDASGPLGEDRLYMDVGSFLGQLGLNPGPHRPLVEAAPGKELVVALGNEEEKANLALVAHSFELFNQHDAKGLVGIMTDDVVFSDSAAPADVSGKKAVQKSFDDLFKGFHDVKLSVDKSWAAGKYVVSEGSFSGTNDGNMPSMKLKKTGKHVNVRFVEIDEVSGGKLTHQRIFDNGMALAMQLGLVPPPGAPDAKKKPAPPKS